MLMAMLGTAATTALSFSTAEWFVAGATAAISIYTGTKLPRNRRK